MRRPTTTTFAVILSAVLLISSTSDAQNKQYRRYHQDAELNNLVHSQGYETGILGELGRVTKVGNGPRSMILIAGAGFGGDIFESFMNSRTEQFTMFAVTLPGFGGTNAPPMPPEGTSYGEQTWTQGAISGIKKLIEKEGLDKPVIIAHWYGATQIGLRLALDFPDLIDSTIIISGIARYAGTTMPAGTPLENRASTAGAMSERWFKTVTRDTWDDNNFMPHDYTRHPIRALQLWRQAAADPLPVWVRYLCESWSQDPTFELADLKVPVLVLKPGFDEELYFDEGRNYMKTFCHDSWDGVGEASQMIDIQTIANSRVFIMEDQPGLLDEAIEGFLGE